MKWATETQGLSTDVIDLTESTESVLAVMDLASNTARNVGLTFETEPSAFVKVLHQLAPRRPPIKQIAKAFRVKVLHQLAPRRPRQNTGD